MKFSRENYVLIWLKRCLLALLFLSFCRILFIAYLFPYFESAPMGQLPLVMFSGVLFDIQAMVYFLSVFHLLSLIPFRTAKPWYEVSMRVFYTLGLGLIVLLNFTDMEFYKIKSRRSGIELFQLLSDPSNPVLSYIMNYWWLSLLFIAFLFCIYYFYPGKRAQFQRPKSVYSTFAFILISGLLFLGARGSFSTKPLRSFDAARFVDPAWVSATINSPTQIITSYSTAVPSPVHYMSEQACRTIVQPVRREHNTLKLTHKPNIVLIILESFGRDYCGYLNGGIRFTPFLDSLSKHSMLFMNAYSSGTTSMESLPAIFASVPSLLQVPYINSNFQNNTLRGAHYYLSRNGYDCSFYYGAENGSMGFDNFLKISGNIQYYGRDEYPSKTSDYDGSWGIWDEPYLQYYADELSRRKAPFFSSVFTLSSHDPYKIPSEYANIYKEESLPIHKAVRYTDHALELFFKKAEQQAWFDNTVFIITADHPSHSRSSYFYTPTGKYEIPLMVYSPKMIPKGANDSFTYSHLDIMPTLLDLGQVTEPFFCMGKSLFDPVNRIAINQDNGIVQVIEYPYCLRLFPNGFKMHFQSKSTPNEKVRYMLTNEEKTRQQRLEKELKARLQLYTNSLLENSFWAN